jgi:hypothetical protein
MNFSRHIKKLFIISIATTTTVFIFLVFRHGSHSNIDEATARSLFLGSGEWQRPLSNTGKKFLLNGKEVTIYSGQVCIDTGDNSVTILSSRHGRSLRYRKRLFYGWYIDTTTITYSFHSGKGNPWSLTEWNAAGGF